MDLPHLRLHTLHSLPDAKIGKHNVQQLLDVDGAGDDAEAVGGDPQLLRGEVHLPRLTRQTKREDARVGELMGAYSHT